jgi:hypothetical protein
MYETVILPVVLYQYETWSLTLSEERRLIDCVCMEGAEENIYTQEG